MNSEWLRSQRQISSKNLITFDVFLVYAPISIFSVVLSVVNQIDSSNVAEAFYLGINITAVTGLVILLLNLVVRFSDSQLTGTTREAVYVSILAMAGAIRGFFMYSSFQFTSFEEPNVLLVQIFSSTFNFMFWVYLIQRVFQDTKIFNETYRLIIRAAILRIAREEGAQHTIRLRQEIAGELKEIQQLISRSIDSATQNALHQEDLIKAANLVQEVIEKKVRPLSHRLWLKSSSAVPKIRMRNAIISSLQNLEVAALPISLGVAFSSAVNLTTNFGLIRGVLSSVLIFVLLMLFYSIIRKLSAKRDTRSALEGVLVLLIPGALLSGVFYLINRFYFGVDLGFQNLIFVPICFFIGVCFSIYELNRGDRAKVIETLEGEFSKRFDKQEVQESFAAEEVASYLHNTLQSELLALSYQMEDSAKNVDMDASRSILERLASRINRSISEDFQSFQEKPLDRLLKIQSAWKGIALVELAIPQELLLDPNRNFVLVQIVEEAISNAVRYQQARQVKVEAIPMDEARMKLTISSDGESSQSGSPGLGTEWLDRYVAGKWHRQIGREKTILEIEL